MGGWQIEVRKRKKRKGRRERTSMRIGEKGKEYKGKDREKSKEKNECRIIGKKNVL